MLFEKNDTILFIGDSISDYERAKPVGEGLFNAWGHSYVACAGALLCCMYPELGLRIVNMGVGGNQIRDLKARWQTDVLDRNHDPLLYGTQHAGSDACENGSVQRHCEKAGR